MVTGTGTALYDVLVNKHHFSSELAAVVSSDLSRSRAPEKADSVLSLLEDNCFSRDQLERIVKSDPRILVASVEDVKLKIKILKDFGFLAEDIAKMSTTNNAVLRSSAEKKIIPQLSALKGLLGSNDEVVGLVKRTTWYMSVDLGKTFVPNVELLKSSGISSESIHMLLCNYPRCLLVKPEIMRQSVEKAKEMGVNQCSKNFVYAVRVIASLNKETWELKMQGVRDLGISDCNVLAMFRKAPLVLCVSLEKMKKVKELLLATGRFDVSSIINDPSTLFISVEKRYKPRLQILKTLETKNLIKKWPSLSAICRYTDAKFFETFVRPYSDQLDQQVFPAKGEERSKK